MGSFLPPSRVGKARRWLRPKTADRKKRYHSVDEFTLKDIAMVPGSHCRSLNRSTVADCRVRHIGFGFLASVLVGVALMSRDAIAKPPQRAVPQASTRQDVPPLVSLHQSIADAWARLPQRNNFAAQQNVAGARHLAGSALVPNAPTASGSYFNDKIAGSNYNYLTAQVGVSTPLWLPGEGTATQNAAQAESLAIEGQVALAHLSLAREVLRLAADAADAANALSIAQRRLTTDRVLAKTLANRFAVGESAQTDSLAADAEASSAVVYVAQAEARLGLARVALAELTGSEALPMLLPTTGLARAADGSEHPQVVAAAQQVEAARAQERLVYIQDRDDPELGVEGINEKQPGTRWDTRFGVTLKFHFATEARNAPRRAVAQENLTRAAVQLELTRRQVAAQIAAARVVLVASERAVTAADRSAAELEKRRGQIERAWKLGEISFIELARANALAYDAEAARDKARVGGITAQLQLQIAEGVIP